MCIWPISCAWAKSAIVCAKRNTLCVALADHARCSAACANKRDATELMGRTECNRVVNFVGQSRLVGQLVDVRITETRPFTLRGEVVTSEAGLAASQAA